MRGRREHGTGLPVIGQLIAHTHGAAGTGGITILQAVTAEITLLSGITAEDRKLPGVSGLLTLLLQMSIQRIVRIAHQHRRRPTQRSHLQRRIQHRLNVIGDQRMDRRAGMQSVCKQILL